MLIIFVNMSSSNEQVSESEVIEKLEKSNDNFRKVLNDFDTAATDQRRTLRNAKSVTVADMGPDFSNQMITLLKKV